MTPSRIWLMSVQGNFCPKICVNIIVVSLVKTLMSHLIKIYAVCKFNYFPLCYLKSSVLKFISDSFHWLYFSISRKKISLNISKELWFSNQSSFRLEFPTSHTTCMQHVWKTFRLQVGIGDTWKNTYWIQTLQMWNLWTSFYTERNPQSSYAYSYE